MAIISMCYGIIISMYFFDEQAASYATYSCKLSGSGGCFSIPDGEMIEGEWKSNKTRLVQAWIEIHQEELMANWELATNGQEIFKIDPLK